MNTRFLAGLALIAALLCPAAWAGEGHSHDTAPAASAAPALPRFVAASELFEMVGIVRGQELTVYLDRFDDNTPVRGATIALEVGGAKVALQQHGDGEFTGTLAQPPQAGITPVTATVTAGQDSDLLAAEIDVHEAPHTDTAPARSMKDYALWTTGALAALALLAVLARRANTARLARLGGAA